MIVYDLHSNLQNVKSRFFACLTNIAKILLCLTTNGSSKYLQNEGIKEHITEYIK